MKYIKNTFNSFSKKRLFIFVLLFSLAGYSLVVFAVAPVGGYTPGQTLDPDCAYNDVDCFVSIPVLTFDSPLVNTGGTISIPAAASGVDGYLSASDWNNFNNKQDSFGFGTTAQYLRGDNTWQNLDTSVVPENGNLYFTNTRFDTRLATATSAANLQTVGTITSGVWHGSQITDAYISDSITASNYIPLSQKGVANGVASLGNDGKVLSSQLSSFSLSDTFVVNSEAEMLNLLSAELGDVAIRLDENKSYILTTNDPTNIANWQQIITPLDFVLAVNGQTGAVNLTTTDIPEGLNLYYTDTRVSDYLNTQKGVANGIASLDANGKIPSSQLGSIILNETRVVADIPAMLAITGAVNGDLTVVTSTSQTFVLADDNNPSNINSWVEIVNGAPVTSVNGQVGTVNLTTTNISEGSNQYFTNARARNALSATGPLSYNALTGVFGITQANNITNGFLSAVDWNIFNNKQEALIFGTVTASSNPEITITGGTGAVIGTGLDISIPDASDSVRGLMTTGTQNFAGIKTFADNVGIGDAAPSELFSVGLGGLFQVDDTGDIIKIKNINYTWPGIQGAIDSVLVNDGSGGLSWASNGVTSLNGLTDATQTFATSSTGTDFSISSSGGIHTFNFPTASATARGALTSTKYTEFNNKPLVDTIYNNIYVGSISAGTVMNGASGGINNIVMGYQAGDTLSTGNNNTLLGYQSGKSITTGVAHAFFAGYQAGLSATSATNSIFIGRQAGSGATSASFASFLGRSAGLNATGAQYGIFVGDNAGNTASSASNAVFLGQNAGYQATSATFTNAIGTSAGYQASGATTANFIGYAAGYTASDADYANMIGRGAGNAATNAQYSNFLGFQSGYNASNAANSIFIGKNAGYGDLVNNTVSGSSIAIGDSAGTGGNSNSIALGASAINTLPNQFLIGSSYTNFNVRGINYVWPAAQAAGSGYVLTNDGSGGLSWSTGLSIGGTSGQLQYNNAGALGGVSGITFDGTNFDAKDSVFRIVDNSDTTKRAIFEVSGIDAGTTRTYTLPNAAGTIALTSDLSGYLKNSIGISGGTTLVGGTASGESLTLSSTSNATKGKILFGTSAYDEVNNRLGIGTTSPTSLLDVRGNASFGTVGVPSLVTITGDASNTALRIANSNSSFYYDIFREGQTTGLLTFQGNQSGATGYLFKNETASGKYFTFSSSGRLGINVLSPTANLQLPAGTATASTAPLKFTSGTNLTTPEAGVMEYDGTSLFFTPASTRYNVLMNNLGLSGGQTIVGGTASGNSLTLSSTSNATKGKILFGTSAYDEANNRLGLRTTNPGSGAIYIQSSGAEVEDGITWSNGARIGYFTAANATIEAVTGGSLMFKSKSQTGLRLSDNSGNQAFSFAMVDQTTTTNQTIVFGGDYSGGYRSVGTTVAGIDRNGSTLSFFANSGAAGSYASFTPNKILTIDGANSRVGIGTTTPSTALEIANGGTLKLGGGTASGQGNILMNSNASATYDTNVTYLGSNSQTMGMIASSTPTFDSSYGPSIFLRGNSYGAISGQRGIAGLIAGNPSSPTAGEGELRFLTGSNALRMVIGYNGNVGIGTGTPTAVLHLKAGTATANTAPLKFTSGTNLTTAEAGAFEYDGSSLFFTRSGALRAGLLMTDAASPFNTYSQSAKGATAFTSGTDNFLGGQLAGGALTAGSNNVMIGTQAGNLSNAGLANTVMIGYFAGQSASGLATGAVFIGSQAGQNSAGATNSIFIGQSSGFNSIATNATFIGNTAGSGATNALDTIGLGQNAARNATGSIESIYLGKNTGYNSTGSGITGDYNIIIGSESGKNLTSGGKNILIGYNLNAQSAATDGQMTIGNLLFGTGIDGTGTTISTGKIGIGTASPSYRFSVSDTTTAGIVGSFTNSDGTCTLDPGDVSGWSCPSDLNLKKDIETLTAGSLDDILALRPVTYRLRNEDNSTDVSTGLIAQEVQTVFPKLVKTQIDGTLALNYGGLTPYMISAIQEMNLRITEINDIEKPNSWRDALTHWFANTANGITEFFSKKVSTEELCVTDSAGQTCITRSQLDALLNGQGVPPQSPTPTPDPTPSPDPVPTPDPGTDPSPSPDPGTDTPPSDTVPPQSDPDPTSEPPASDSTPAPDPGV